MADVAGSSCSADLTVTFPDGTTTTLDGCADWDFDATFEYDPDDPPEVNSFTFTLGATTEADFDCRIELVQQGVCGPGYYDERDDATTTTAVLMDCAGAADEYEGTFSSHEGYLRIDTIEAGTEAGSFAGEPLLTNLGGYLDVSTNRFDTAFGATDAVGNGCEWYEAVLYESFGECVEYLGGTDIGLDSIYDLFDDDFNALEMCTICGGGSSINIEGTIDLTLVQIAGDSEESASCANVADESVDADGDGYNAPYFGGDDCNDDAPYINPSIPEVCDGGVDNNCNGVGDEGLSCTHETSTTVNTSGWDGGEDWAYVTHIHTGREVISHEEAEIMCLSMGYEGLAPRAGRIAGGMLADAAEVGFYSPLVEGLLVDVFGSGAPADCGSSDGGPTGCGTAGWAAVWVDSSDGGSCVVQTILAGPYFPAVSVEELSGLPPLSCSTSSVDLADEILSLFEHVHLAVIEALSGAGTSSWVDLIMSVLDSSPDLWLEEVDLWADANTVLTPDPVCILRVEDPEDE